MKILSHRRSVLPAGRTALSGPLPSDSTDRPISVVTGRLPTLQRSGQDPWADLAPTELPGSLIPGLRSGNGRWFGCMGGNGVADESALAETSHVLGCHLSALELTAGDVQALDSGFAHSALWPLFHGQLGNCSFDQDDWNTYVAINKRFADELGRCVDTENPLWVADHQLMLVARQLRQSGRSEQAMSFLMQMPVPGPDEFAYLPWRSQIIDGLLAHDRIAVQTARDQRNLLASVAELGRDARVEGERIHYQGRVVTVQVLPIGVDFDEIAERADSDPVRALIVEQKYAAQHRRIILGVDTLDASAGLIERCRIIEHLFEQNRELAEQVLYVQVIRPTRHCTPSQRALKAELDREMGRVSGRFSHPTYSPIRYVYRDLAAPLLSALYRSCDVALVAPLCDGVSRTALEFCASRIDEDGVLVLGERASAVHLLRDTALLVNPFDTGGAAAILHQALTMPADERADRMRRARTTVKAMSANWLTEIRRSAPAHAVPRLSDRLPTSALQPTGSL